MRQTNELIKRNFRLYIRDGGKIFFSMLAMLILVILMLVFLGKMNISEIVDLFAQFGVPEESIKSSAEQYVLWWTVAGLLAVNTITIPLGGINTMINDVEEGRMASFLVSPASRLSIAVGYIGASWLATMFMDVLCLAASEAVVVAKGAELLTFGRHALVIAILALNSFLYSTLMYFVAQLVRTSGAWGGFGTIVSTLAGFLGGIYIPLGSLSDAVQTGMKCTPVLHSVAAMRQVMCDGSADKMFALLPAEVSSQVRDEYELIMGVRIAVGENTLSLGAELAIIAVCGIIILAAAVLLANRKRKSDR